MSFFWHLVNHLEGVQDTAGENLKSKLDMLITVCFSDGYETPGEFIETVLKLIKEIGTKKPSILDEPMALAYVSDQLFIKMKETFGCESAQLSQLAKLRSMSHFHYLTGSREPASLLNNRRDLFNDPRVAIAKFKDDIEKLMALYINRFQLTDIFATI